MGAINTEDILGIYENGRLRAFTGGALPDGIAFNDILTREMVESSDAVYFDDFTGEQIT